jgi:choline dehydrogenase-like flavoprotein
LERGEYLKREQANWSTRDVFAKARYQTKEVWNSSDGKRFSPGLHYYVGGNSKFYGAVLFRLRQSDFNAVRHPDGVSPEWVVKYDEFEPYYQAAEELFHVHGLRGEDPTEPPAPKPFAYPPIKHEPRVAELSEGLKAGRGADLERRLPRHGRHRDRPDGRGHRHAGSLAAAAHRPGPSLGADHGR